LLQIEYPNDWGPRPNKKNKIGCPQQISPLSNYFLGVKNQIMFLFPFEGVLTHGVGCPIFIINYLI
jgi:hypothetical protein